MKVYLAGGIAKNDWRHLIVQGLSGVSLPAIGDAPILRKSIHIYGEHDYVGPFFVSCDHGGYHGPKLHGALPGLDGNRFSDGPPCCAVLHEDWKELLSDELKRDATCKYGDLESIGSAQELVYRRAISGISQADYFFAWLDRKDLWGTVFELGVARGLALRTGLPKIGVFIDYRISDFSENEAWFPLIDAQCGGERSPVEDFERDFAQYVSYDEVLLSPKWQKRRLEILEKRNWKCERCESTTATLHVHHKQYMKGLLPWEGMAENFEVLCSSCHEKNHRSKQWKKNHWGTSEAVLKPGFK